jgi:hypothetical protein
VEYFCITSTNAKSLERGKYDSSTNANKKSWMEPNLNKISHGLIFEKYMGYTSLYFPSGHCIYMFANDVRASPPVYRNRNHNHNHKSGSHKGMNQNVMVTVEKVSPTGATITITFMVLVTATINLVSLWGDFT